jgi:hypothetical protein
VTRGAEDDDYTNFIRFEGLRPPGEGQDAVLSLAAFQMHGFGMMNSIKDGHPGLVSDDYLNAISAETSITATELCTAGLWVRVHGGYEIMDEELLDMSIDGNRRARRMQQCEDALGGRAGRALPRRRQSKALRALRLPHGCR